MKRIKIKSIFDEISIKKDTNPRYFEGISASEQIDMSVLIEEMLSGFSIDSNIYIAKLDKEHSGNKYYVVDGNRRMIILKIFKYIDEGKTELFYRTVEEFNLFIKESVKTKMLTTKINFTNYIDRIDVLICENLEEVREAYQKNHVEDKGKKEWKTINRFIHTFRTEGYNGLGERASYSLGIFSYITLTDFEEKLNIVLKQKINMKYINQKIVLDTFKGAPTSFADILMKNNFDDFSEKNQFTNIIIKPIQNEAKLKLYFKKIQKDEIESEKLIEETLEYKFILALTLLAISKQFSIWNTPYYKLFNVYSVFKKMFENNELNTDLEYNKEIKILLDEFENIFGLANFSNEILIKTYDIPEEIRIKDGKGNITLTEDVKKEIIYSKDRKESKNLLFISYASKDIYFVNFIVHKILIDLLGVDLTSEVYYFSKVEGKTIRPENVKITSRDDELKYIKKLLKKKTVMTVLNLSYSFLFNEFTLLESGKAWLTDYEENSGIILYLSKISDDHIGKFSIPKNDPPLVYKQNHVIFDVTDSGKVCLNVDQFVTSYFDVFKEMTDFLNKKREPDEKIRILQKFNRDSIEDLWNEYQQENEKYIYNNEEEWNTVVDCVHE